MKKSIFFYLISLAVGLIGAYFCVTWFSWKLLAVFILLQWSNNLSLKGDKHADR